MAPTRRQFMHSAASAALAAPFLELGLQGRAPRRGERPNVLVVVIDTLRADHVLGDRARTPNIDALMRDGLTFTRTFPEAMPTVPARNSILTGRRRFPFRGWEDRPGLLAMPGWGPIGDTDATFTSVLRRAGWWTAYVTDNPFLGFARPYESFRESFDLFERRGGQIGGKSGGVPRDEVMHWVHPTTRDGKTIERVTRYMANSSYAHDEGRSFAASVFTSGVGALRAAAAGRKPFALVVDTFEPHEPWTPPRRYIDMYGDPDHRGAEPGMPRYSRVENWLDERQAAEVLPRMRALYAAEVTMTDRWLGVLLDELHAQQLERDTVVVLVGDHGFLLGEHGWTGKISVSLHPELTNVPLIVVDPRRRRAGERSAYRASTHDIGRTVLRLCGVKPPEEMEGADLSRILRGGEPPARDYSYGGYANCHFLRDDRWTYFSDNLMNRPHLFDVRSDPDEAEDVAAKHPDVVRRLHRTVVERAGGRLPYYPE